MDTRTEARHTSASASSHESRELIPGISRPKALCLGSR